MSEEKQLYGADLVVDSLINHDVDYVFGIPGAKIDRVFDTLEDKGPELIVARHEQNAAFMAQGVGRITGKPGVVLVLSLIHILEKLIVCQLVVPWRWTVKVMQKQ